MLPEDGLSGSHSVPDGPIESSSTPDQTIVGNTTPSPPFSALNSSTADNLPLDRGFAFIRSVSVTESTNDGILTPTTDDSHSEASHLPSFVFETKVKQCTPWEENTAAIPQAPLESHTENTPFTDSSIPTINTFAMDLQSAIDSAWPMQSSSLTRRPYQAVHVLLVSWEDGQPGTWADMKRLEYVFSTLYHFEVQEVRIPSRGSGDALNWRVESFVESGDGEGNLLVLYYTGCAKSGIRGDGAVWAATDSINSPTVASAGIQRLFGGATADVLMLFDSPFSPSPIIQGEQGVTEALAACGMGDQYPAVMGQHSFTNELVKELEEAFSGPPISIAEIHGRMIGSIRDRKPELFRNTHGNLVADENGRPRYAPLIKRRPVHHILTNELPRRSVFLSPLPLKHGRNTTSSNSRRATDGRDRWCRTTQSQHSSNPPETSIKHPRVLLSVLLEENCFPSKDENADSVWEWAEWLRDIPSGPEPVAIEAVYKGSSTSTLLIVSLPFLVWDMLPQNTAYSFIGFVDSGNLQDVVEAPPVPVHVSVPDILNERKKQYDERDIEKEVQRRVEAELATRELASLRREKEEWLLKAEIEKKEAVARALTSSKSFHRERCDNEDKDARSKAPIKFKDAVGRKLCFPFHMAATWNGVEELIKQAFLHVDVLGPHVNEGHYDLICANGGLSGEIILPQVWET
ncbi:hypothetical protein IFR05_009053, partial [Cadophora sp. M221]